MRKKDPQIMNRICNYIDEYYLEHHCSPSISKIAYEIDMAKSSIHRYLLEMNEKDLISYDKNGIQTETTRKVSSQMSGASIIGSISCGTPVLTEENIEEYISLPVSIFGKGDLFILHASGDSMIDAGIEDGDLVVIRKQTTAEDGDIVVALINNENTLKRFYIDKKNKKYILHPENSRLKDIVVTDVQIQGVAQHVIKSLL